MKLFGHPFSTCTRKVMLALAEKNAAYEFVKVDIMKGEQKHANYLAMHPFGVIPVLEDNGFQIYESRAIIRYLDKRLPGAALTPTDIQQFGQMEQWLSVEQSYFTPPALQIIKEIVFAPMRGNQPDLAIVEQAKPKVVNALAVIDKQLIKQPYLAGDNFSLADISWMPYVDYLFAAKMGALITEHAGVNAWWERVSQRLSWLKVVK